MMLSTIATAALLFLTGASEGAPAAETRPRPLTLEPLVAARATAFRASVVHLGDGTRIENGVVLVQDGVIHRVGSDVQVPEGAAVVDLDGELSPGLVASHGYHGLNGERLDSTRPVLPGADIANAFRPDHLDFERSLAAGITSVVLAPSTGRMIPGTTAVVKTAGETVVRRPAQLQIVLSDAALSRNRFPTSHQGAMAELDRLFSQPEGPIARAAAGNLPVLLAVGDRGDAVRAVEFAGRYRLRGALYGSFRAEDVVEPIAKSGLGVVANAFDVGEDARAARSVVALAERGVRLGFALDAPARSADCLRFGVALCVRAGLDPQAALKALCSDAAALAGVERRVGKLERGLDADLVLWSGDPLELSSSVRAVYVDGELVHGGEE